MERINDVTERYRKSATRHWRKTLSDIEKVKKAIRKKYVHGEKRKAVNEVNSLTTKVVGGEWISFNH